MAIWSTYTRPWDAGYQRQFTGPSSPRAEQPQAATNQFTNTDPFELADQTNRFQTGQVLQPYMANMPNYSALSQARSNVVGQQMQGNVPSDVVNQIIQRGAERGILTGSPGGPGANAAYLQALGLTSLGQQQQGVQNFSQAIADTPVPETLNPASIFVPERFAQQELDAYRNPNPIQRQNFGGATQFYTPPAWAPSIQPFYV